MELFLVAGHDAHHAVGVQVTGQILHFQTAGRELLHRELEQRRIIGLIVELTAGTHHTAVFVQKSPMGQTPLGILLPGPGVGKIDKQTADLTGGENFLDVGHIHIDEKHIGKTHALGLFHGHHHGFPAALHRDQQDVRIGLGGLGGKFALAAAHLYPKVLCIRLQRAPIALLFFGLDDAVSRAFFHAGL